MAIFITPHISLTDDEVTLRAVRASGPGGQHVNKVSTGVLLRFDARRSPSLPEPVRRRLLEQAGSRASADGVIVIQADRFRSQLQNREEAVERLRQMIVAATRVPKKRHATRPGKGAKKRRLDAKKRRGDTKRMRGPVKDD